jgi:hypothetical protein
VTGSRIGDAPVLPDLPDRIPCDRPLGIGTTQGARGTRAGHAAIAARAPAAVVPPRRNGKPRRERTAGATARGEARRRCRRLGRTIRKRRTGCHRRNPVAAKVRCLELNGGRVLSRDFDRQVAEIRVRAAIPNRFTALGPPLTRRAGRVCPRQGKVRPSSDLGNEAGSSLIPGRSFPRRRRIRTGGRRRNGSPQKLTGRATGRWGSSPMAR